MKKIYLLVLIIFAVFSTFAESDQDAVELKGKILIENRIHAELMVNGEIYSLSIPRPILFTIKEGEEITVKGYKTANNRYCYYGYDNDNVNNSNHIFVTEITVNGKTINIDEEFRKNRRKDGYECHRNGKGRGY
ncbi:MAG: hypothetical protein KAT05_00250 [Spirochaetes bacterium]|nr:hypothetical protein [Spirochaetota bacterium]